MCRVRVIKDRGEKIITRPLYQQAFSDTEEFVDYYYREKCRDNLIVIKEDQGAVISMVHLNPYTVVIDGQDWRIFYLVAVATEKSRRHEGHMRDVLSFAFQLMHEQCQPFCYLMPVDEKIYEPFGFEVIGGFDRNPNRPLAEIEKNFDIYCKRDSTYLKRMEAEKKLAAQYQQEEGLPQEPVIMAKVIDQTAFARLSGLDTQSTEHEKLDWLRNHKIYFCEEV